MTKEEIQAQINVLQEFLWTNRYVNDWGKEDIRKEIERLQGKLQQSKSIQDLKREVFEAGVEFGLEYAGECEGVHPSTKEYDISESYKKYLKSQENGI